jgi:hypothetical protein
MTDSTSSTNPAFAHPNYFFEDGNVTFRVENVLFKVHKSILARESPFFKDMFSLPPDINGDKTGTNNPIPIPETTASDFENLLRVLYLQWGTDPDYTDPQLVQLMKLSHKWQFDRIRRHATSILSSRNLSHVDRLELGRIYDLPELAFPAFAEIVRSMKAPSSTEMDKLGPVLSVAVLKAQNAFILRQNAKLAEAVFDRTGRTNKVLTRMMKDQCSTRDIRTARAGRMVKSQG